MRGQYRGFTIIELLITMVVVIILLTIGTLASRGLLAKSRDNERKNDIAVIAQALERRYNNGNKVFAVASSTNQPILDPGSYPSVAELLYGCHYTRAIFSPDTTTQPGCDALLQAWSLQQAAITPPSQSTPWIDAVCWSSCSAAETQSQVENSLKSSGNWADKYIYEPIDDSNNVCINTVCRRYNLYWRSEVDGTINKVKSRHQ